RKITASPHKPASVLGVADFRLLRDMLIPEYGTWYVIFATNAMTIHYTESSPGSSALTRDNWWDILQQDNITIGYSDPARDPAGYRAEMVLELGTIPFQGTQLYEKDIYEALKQNTTVTAGDEIHLISQLKSGKIDYAINYRSLARTADIEYLSLQPQVNLAKFTEQYATHYHRASVQTSSGTYRGAPIAYGVTIPTTRRFPRIGQQFIKALLSSTGTDILQSHGFRPITPAIGTSIQSDGIPQSLTPLIKNRQTFGPLSLRP
ncbi:MAG: extracellular solute-binding protein, partial [Halobacteriaceae archaeon]